VFRIFAALATALCCACASTHTLDALSPQAVVIDVPVLQQTREYECGFIALEIVCRHHGRPLASACAEELRASALRNDGLSGAEIRSALERSGYEAYVFAGTLDRAATGAYGHLDRGRPLIAMSSTEDGHRHFEVLIGYDAPRDNLILLDPVRGRVARARTVFESGWARCGRFLLLALPQANEPASQPPNHP
jgi:ABC-type bacteriocin/lantibiotic exporter with double-glycine peptidase domain